MAQARALLPLDALVLAGGEAQARVVMVVAIVSSIVLWPKVLGALKRNAVSDGPVTLVFERPPAAL